MRSEIAARQWGTAEGETPDAGEQLVRYARERERASHRRHLLATTGRALAVITRASAHVDEQDLVRLAADEAARLRDYVEWLGRHEGCDLIVALRRLVAQASLFGGDDLRLVPGPIDNTLPGAEAEAMARDVRDALAAIRAGGESGPITLSVQERNGEALVRLRANRFQTLAEIKRGAALLSGGVARATIGNRVEQARAAERRRLRCALHDATLQTLEYLGNDGYDSVLAREEIVALAERARRDLLAAVDEPVVACELLPGLREVVSETRATAGLEVELVTGEVDESVHGEEAAALVAAVREALNNVRKHARAQRVVVQCEATEGEARITVRDDGVGFDPSTATSGVGLVSSIADRVTEHGGRARLHSAPGRGVLVTLTMTGSRR